MYDVHERDRQCEFGRGQKRNALERAPVLIVQEAGRAQ
jgi:hypothetical protein